MDVETIVIPAPTIVAALVVAADDEDKMVEAPLRMGGGIDLDAREDRITGLDAAAHPLAELRYGGAPRRPALDLDAEGLERDGDLVGVEIGVRGLARFVDELLREEGAVVEEGLLDGVLATPTLLGRALDVLAVGDVEAERRAVPGRRCGDPGRLAELPGDGGSRDGDERECASECADHGCFPRGGCGARSTMASARRRRVAS